VQAYYPSTQEAESGGLKVWGQPDLHGETLPQKNKSQGCSLVVQHLPIIYEALNLKLPSTSHTKRNKLVTKRFFRYEFKMQEVKWTLTCVLCGSLNVYSKNSLYYWGKGTANGWIFEPRKLSLLMLPFLHFSHKVFFLFLFPSYIQHYSFFPTTLILPLLRK
jgi:hypothetical protein